MLRHYFDVKTSLALPYGKPGKGVLSFWRRHELILYPSDQHLSDSHQKSLTPKVSSIHTKSLLDSHQKSLGFTPKVSWIHTKSLLDSHQKSLGFTPKVSWIHTKSLLDSHQKHALWQKNKRSIKFPIYP